MKVETEVRQCDCCDKLYSPQDTVLAEYELYKNGKPLDLCSVCKKNLIRYMNRYTDIVEPAEGPKEEITEEPKEEKKPRHPFFNYRKDKE